MRGLQAQYGLCHPGVMSRVLERAPRFAQAPPEPPADLPKGPKPPSFWQQTVQVGKNLFHKVTSLKRFTAGLKNGYQESKADLNKVWTTGTKWELAQRAGAEALGLVVLIVCSPLPAPNPGWLLSPTARAFLKGFLKTDPPAEPPPPPSPGTPE